eukprot:COSAG01_NODE_1091_length_11743_cov_52.449244_9_plen_769_part_00
MASAEEASAEEASAGQEPGAESAIDFSNPLTQDAESAEIPVRDSDRTFSKETGLEGSPAESEGTCTRWARRYWATRQEEYWLESDNSGMNPYVEVKLGRHGLSGRTKYILTKDGDDPEKSTSPKWGPDDHNEFTLTRTKGDKDEIIVDVYHQGLNKEFFVGGCQADMRPFIEHAELEQETSGQLPEWHEVMLNLYDQQVIGDHDGDGMSGANGRDAGSILMEYKWDTFPTGETDGTLRVRVLSGTDLKDVTGTHVSDISSFADHSALRVCVYLLLSYIVVAFLFYFYAMRDSDRGVLDTRNWEALDTLVFIVTTFTTVGFGDHNLIPPNSYQRVFTVSFIIVGMGILGVVVGAVGDVVAVKIQERKKKMRSAIMQQFSKEKNVQQAAISGAISGEMAFGKLNIRRKAEASLRKKGKLSEGDAINQEQLREEMQTVMMKNFWATEVMKVILSAGILAFVLAVGTVTYMLTEQDETYPVTHFECLSQNEEYSSNRQQPLHCNVTDPVFGNLRKYPQHLEMNTHAIVSEEHETWICAANTVETGELKCQCRYTMIRNFHDSKVTQATWLLDKDSCVVTGLTVIDSLYFTTVAASTVGYGDIAPKSTMGKWFSVLYIPVAVAVMSKTIMSLALIPMDYRRLKLEEFVLDQFGEQLSAPDFTDLKKSVNLGMDESIRKNDFTLAMLLRLGRVGPYDIARIEQTFGKLDRDNNGQLEKADLQNLLGIQSSRLERAKTEAGHDIEIIDSKSSNSSSTTADLTSDGVKSSPTSDMT